MKISTVSSIENIKVFCEKYFRDSSPFISYDFFKYLEKSGCTNTITGWEPEHILIENNTKNNRASEQKRLDETYSLIRKK